MSNLVPYNDIERMATAIAKSNLFGIKTPDQAVALMLIAQAEGMHPAIAARDYHVIQGRPALKADAMLARFQAAGGKVAWKTYTDLEVTGEFSHAQGGSVSVTWTMEMAKRIGLASKDNWKNFPRAMLRSRCISEGIRTVYPGCVVGVYTPEEVQDFDATPAERNMGKAEEVLAEPLPTEEGEWKLWVPGNDKPFSAHHSIREWQDQYMILVSRIMASPKLADGQKAEKLSALRSANDDVIENMPAVARVDLNARIAEAGGHVEVKKEEPDEMLLSETTF